MSGTEEERFDGGQMGLIESGEVKQLFIAPDGLQYGIEHTRCVVKKFDGEVSEMTEEEAAAALAEVIITDDGEITEHWIRGESEHGPPEG